MYHSPAPASLLVFLVLQNQLNHILGPLARPIKPSSCFDLLHSGRMAKFLTGQSEVWNDTFPAGMQEGSFLSFFVWWRTFDESQRFTWGGFGEKDR